MPGKTEWGNRHLASALMDNLAFAMQDGVARPQISQPVDLLMLSRKPGEGRAGADLGGVALDADCDHW